MSLNPLNELKRRLEDDATPLPKRLCLAKNVVGSYHFATAPKERIVGNWLQDLEAADKLNREDLKGIFAWLSTAEELTSELKCKLIELVSHYIKKNTVEIEDIECILSFLECAKMSPQLSLQIDNYLSITITLLRLLQDNPNVSLSQRILNNYIKYYRESKKKLEFIVKLLNQENLEIIFGYLDTEHRKTVIDVCQHILFPINKRSFFISFLQTLIRKDNLDELIAEKGDNIQSVIKIMNTLFEFSGTDSEISPKFLINFIDVFVACFRNETQIVFAFFIMVANVFGMEQNFIVPAMNLSPIIEDNAKVKRNLFLKMLEILLTNEIDINVRLTDTFGEKIPKVETKKTFTTFLQTVLIGQLKLEGKIDKATLQIITTALKLDPVLIEQKIETILPPIVAVKKNETNMQFYIEMLNCLLDILFKLSRGILFVDQILPFVKPYLEAGNTEQADLQKSIKDAVQNSGEVEKIENKIINGSDLFPNESVEVYGKLSSELMFRQNKELLQLFQKNLEEHCLILLEEGFVTPSVVTLTEVLSAILSSFFKYNKMTDHVVPSQIAEEFWDAFKIFEGDSLKRFGECVLKINNNSVTLSFLKLCVNFSHLKLLNLKYSNTKLEIRPNDTSEVLDLSSLLPCLASEQWITLLSKIEDDELLLLLDDLLLAKSMALQLKAVENRLDCPNEHNSSSKTYLIKQLNSHPDVINNNYFCKTLFNNLDKSQCKQLSKILVKMYLANPELGIFNIDAIIHNKILLNSLVMESAKQAAKCFESGDVFSKAISKSDFNITTFAKTNNMKELLLKFTLQTEDHELRNFVDIFKQIQIYYLDEPYQLLTIFLMLAIKKVSTSKKVRRNIDQIMQSIYELSSQQPDLYQIFSVDDIFSFDDKILLDLLTLKLKSSNSSLIIRNILELAVKKVRVDSELVKRIVDLLLVKNEKIANFDAFSEPKFQITCLMLPFIFKQKKAITASAFRSILADLQERLHKKLLKSFKKIDLVSSNLNIDNGNTEGNMVESENSVAILNAMAAFSLTLSRYCETTDTEELKNLDCLWSGLEVFVQLAIKTIENPTSKFQHIESSVHLINTSLRYIKKLETHSLFHEKDKIFLQIWQATRTRLLLAFEGKKGVILGSTLEDFGVTLKFLCELTSVECFATKFIADLTNLVVLKKPVEVIIKSETTSDQTNRKTFKYLFTQCLKANIVGPKCVAISKLLYRTCKNLRFWLRQHYDSESSTAINSSENITIVGKISTNNGTILKVEDEICILIRSVLDCLSELLLAAKKVSIDYKFLDTVFELLHLVQHITSRCEVTWTAYFTIYEGSVSVLNNLLLAREEILEDRWPCYMQSYRALVASLCQRASSQTELDRYAEKKLAETAHTIEKLTQMITKRKKHVSRIAAYTVADLCAWIELNAPTKMVRIHIENCVAMLIQASDNTYAMAFLRRALAGSAGQMTMTNLYTMYKRYHKYVGNA